MGNSRPREHLLACRSAHLQQTSLTAAVTTSQGGCLLPGQVNAIASSSGCVGWAVQLVVKAAVIVFMRSNVQKNPP